FGHKFNFEYGKIGACAIEEFGNPYPHSTHKLCSESDAILFGAIGSPLYDNNPHAKVRPEEGLLAMREQLGLFTNIRPIEIFDSLIERSPLKREYVEGLDIVIVRELTGGLYFGKPRGREEGGTTAVDTCRYTTVEIERVAREAFKLALERNRKVAREPKVTLVDKANVLESSRLWREVVTKIHKEEFPSVELEMLFVDNASMQLITAPTKFDIILTENMFGDILSDEASVLTGSIGLIPSASYGSRVKLYEPIHGSYPQAAGKGIANPIATILSGAMMLESSFSLFKEGELIREGVKKAIERNIVTPDLSSKSESYSTGQVGEFIANYLLSA
ncbi:MAG: 3-isopropylmalate dehydrogenase, partial [Bacteroidales bacterium]